MSKSMDRGNSAPAGQPGGDVMSLLLKMQRQLVFLEKKIDSLMHQLQERQYRENSYEDKVFTKKSHSKTKPVSGRLHSRENKKYREKSEEKGPEQAFYSKFRKTNAPLGSGSRKKPFHHKRKVRK